MTAPSTVPRFQRGVGRALRWVARAFAALPAPVAYAIADLAAIPIAAFTWIHERRVTPQGRGMVRNHRIAFRDEFSPARSRRLLLAWARHVSWLVVDFFRLPLTDATNVAERIDVSAFSRIRALDAEGRGVICVSGHIGVWEHLGHLSTLQGVPVTIVARPFSMAPVDREVTRIRRSGGQQVLAKWRVLWPLVRTLRRGGVIGLLADEDHPDRPVFAPFLGTLAASSPVSAFLQRVTGAPIAVVSCLRIARERFRLHVWQVIRSERGDPEAETRRVVSEINEALSRAILADPPQWLWGSRRFQTRPPDEKPGPDGLPPPASSL